MADASDLRATVARLAAQAHVLAAVDVRTALRRAAPYDTGETSRSVDVNGFRTTSSQVLATVEATTPQAGYTEHGTRPHVILPRRAKVLRFRVGGRTVYARRVNHPGTPPRPWFAPTCRTVWPTALASAFRRLG